MLEEVQRFAVTLTRLQPERQTAAGSLWVGCAARGRRHNVTAPNFAHLHQQQRQGEREREISVGILTSVPGCGRSLAHSKS